MSETEKNIGFEEALARLEQIVRALESENIQLDQSLALFEEGIGLVKICNNRLSDAEQKIKILVATPSGEMEEKDFGKSE